MNSQVNYIEATSGDIRIHIEKKSIYRDILHEKMNAVLVLLSTHITEMRSLSKRVLNNYCLHMERAPEDTPTR